MALAFPNSPVLQLPLLDARCQTSYQPLALLNTDLLTCENTPRHKLSGPADSHDVVEATSVLPSIDDCISVLQECRKSKSLMHIGNTLTLIHGSGLDCHRDVGNYLVPMFAECGRFEVAEQVFRRLEQRNEHSWTSLIQGAIDLDELDLAFTLFEEMQREHIWPSKHTYVALLNGSARLKNLGRGQELHSEIAGDGLELFSYVGNALVDMYAKCGALAEASDVHHTMVDRDVVSWTSLISGYTEQGFGEEALKYWQQMQVEGVSPNEVTILCSLKACGTIGDLSMGKQIFAHLVVEELEKVPFIQSTLVDMYAKCGLLVEAQELFDIAEVRDTVAWNTLIAGYAEHGFGKQALRCLDQMNSDGVPSDTTTYVSSLKACGSIGAIDKGRELHQEAVVKELECDLFVGSTVVGMYARCGAIIEAQDVLEELPTQGIVTWNALIAGFAEHGLPEEALYSLKQMQAQGFSSDVIAWSAVILGFVEQGDNEGALELFFQMQEQGVAPNRVTYPGILKACGNLAAVKFGKEVHARISSSGLEAASTLLATALIDMYGDCGSMEYAEKVFDALPMKDVTQWNALIRGYARQGNSKAVSYLTEKITNLGMKTDGIRAVNVLTVCGHVGMIEEGQVYFESMTKVPTVQHQNCMINILCQAGQFDVVVGILENTPLQPDLVTWGTLLGACHKWGDIDLGSRIFNLATRSLGEDAASFISLSNIFADAGQWYE